MSEQGYRRITDYLEEYWNEKRGARKFPSLEDIDIEQLDHAERKDIFIVEFLPTVYLYNPKFVYLGENLSNEYKTDESGRTVRNIVLSFTETSKTLYNKVIESEEPLYQDEVHTSKDGTAIKYRQLLLPLGPDDEKPVNGVLGCMRYTR